MTRKQKAEAAHARGVHYGTMQPSVTDRHLKTEAATRYGGEAEQRAFIDGYKTVARQET